MGDQDRKRKAALLDQRSEGASSSKQARHAQSLEADFVQSMYGFHVPCSQVPNHRLMFAPDSAHHSAHANFPYGLPNPQPAVASEARRKRKAAMALKIGEPNNASSASRRSTRSRISLGRENTAEQEKQGYAQTSQIIAPTPNEAEDPTLRRPNRHRRPNSAISSSLWCTYFTICFNQETTNINMGVSVHGLRSFDHYSC